MPQNLGLGSFKVAENMAPFHRPYTTFYWSAILSILFFSYLTLNNVVTLKSRLGVTQVHWKWHHSKACVWFPFAFYCNYGCIFSHSWDIQHQRMAWPWKLGYVLFNL